jgi:hypothetical protein
MNCPNCNADWRRTELLGEASHGGGYRVLCHVCGNEWDDVQASHGDRETLRRKDRAAAAALSPKPRKWWHRLFGDVLGPREALTDEQ